MLACMGVQGAVDGGLFAISDLHVGHSQNRRLVERLRPRSPGDWLLLCGDVGEAVEEIEWALSLLANRFATVVWVPGNHELWTLPEERVPLRGVPRYEYLVDLCRRLGVLTPEDRFPIWEGPGGPATVVPLFLLYDYSFRAQHSSHQGDGAGARHSGRCRM